VKIEQHPQKHPLAGRTVRVSIFDQDEDFYVYDWFDRVFQAFWLSKAGGRSAQNYAKHAGFKGLPLDNEVVYGRVGKWGTIVHATELEGL
jgi:hypothetical protein